MLRLIAYDIKDARRLRKAARICADYGMRIEYSVLSVIWKTRCSRRCSNEFGRCLILRKIALSHIGFVRPVSVIQYGLGWKKERKNRASILFKEIS